MRLKQCWQGILVSPLGMVMNMSCHSFLDVFLNINDFKNLSNFSKKLHNVFGYTWHKNTAMFNKYSKKHNNGINVEFIKTSDCMYVSSFHDKTSIVFVYHKCLELPPLQLHSTAGHQIAILHMICLKGAPQDTITSSKFKEFKVFKDIAYVLLRDDIWQYLFVMC